MANYTVINLDDYRKSKEGGVIPGKELEPRGPSPAPSLEVHENVPLTVPPAIKDYVEAHEEHIDPERLKGTPAEADGTSSHFREFKPIAEHELAEREGFLNQVGLFFKGIFMRKKDSQESVHWHGISRLAHHRRKEVRQEQEKEAA